MNSTDLTLKHIGNALEESESELTRGINYLLAIGIDEYHHQPRLHNCVKDVKDILAILTLNYTFSMDNATELYDTRATSQNILMRVGQALMPVTFGRNQDVTGFAPCYVWT